MFFYVAVTDNEWYQYLSKINPDEVNFWRPSGLAFKAIEIGAPFLFKLHSPLNVIAGGGFFVRSDRLPLSLAWGSFGQKNGAANLPDLRRLILAHRKGSEIDPLIGCIILNEPSFFPEDRWIPVPDDWHLNIVTGKTYDTSTVIGKKLWDLAAPLLMARSVHEPAEPFPVSELPSGYGKEYLARARLGQGAFQSLVRAAYQRRCAITGEKTLPVLQASHIKPFSESGPNRVENGLLLRSDLHILFDNGYLTITPEYRIEVSRRIKDEFHNGRDYYPLHGQQLRILPSAREEKPGREFISWHNEKIFTP